MSQDLKSARVMRGQLCGIGWRCVMRNDQIIKPPRERELKAAHLPAVLLDACIATLLASDRLEAVVWSAVTGKVFLQAQNNLPLIISGIRNSQRQRVGACKFRIAG